MLKISFEKANAKASGREYEYVSISFNGTELTRIFIKQTEKQYFSTLLGIYEKKKD